MVQERPNQFADATPAPEIDALFAMSNAMSIFDRLMALPRGEAELSNEWDRAVSNRLQARVSTIMRSCIESPEDCRVA